jgi:hypothetical protein
MPLRQRLAVALLFGMGIIVTVAGIIRTWFIYRSLFNEWDATWYSYPLWIAAAIEIDLGVVSITSSHLRVILTSDQICASAPVLRPLLSKIPFSLSATFSRGISFKKSSGAHSKASGNPAPKSNTSALSKRRADTIQGAPELSKDLGRSYELKEWDDLEQGATLNDNSRGSQEGILEEGGASSGKPLRSLWRKGSQDGSKNVDMTITKTSEIELQISSASDRHSKRMSRQPTPRRDTP